MLKGEKFDAFTLYLDERMNAYLQKSEDNESKGFMDAVRITDFPIRDHKVILVLRRRRWKNKETGETFVDRISVTSPGASGRPERAGSRRARGSRSCCPSAPPAAPGSGYCPAP